MKCALCNGKIVSRKGGLEFKSKILGKVTVPNISYFECKDCEDRYYNEKMAVKIHDYLNLLEANAIKSLPIGEFIPANDAAKKLGITKQAFSKNPKIRNGFILSVRAGSRLYYHSRSVQLFKLNGDGRFLLSEYSPSADICKKCEIAINAKSDKPKKRHTTEVVWANNVSKFENYKSTEFGKADDYKDEDSAEKFMDIGF